MPFKKINRTTTSEAIVKQILANIEAGELSSGDKLPAEKELAASFGVSKASVREALRALTLMGYLDVFQGKGAFLKEVLPGDAQATDKLNHALAAGSSLDLIDIRNLLECKAVALAAQRGSSAQLAKIESAVAAMEQSVSDLDRFYPADRAFHLAVMEAANNQTLLEIINLLLTQIRRDRDRFLGLESSIVSDCAETARQVSEAIAAGDGNEAVKRMGVHLQLVAREIETIVRTAPATVSRQDR